MASYLRNLFGSSSSRPTSQRSQSSSSKSHHRTRSVPSPINTNTAYVYNGVPSSAAPASAAPGYTSSSGTRSHSPTTSRTTRPSPLRYNTYDSSTISSKTRPTRPLPSSSHGSISYKSGDAYLPYPIYTPTATSTYSSRSNSNSSMAPPSAASGYAPSHRPAAPRTSSSTSVASRPALKQTHTWHGHGSKADGPKHHVSFVNPNRPQTLHMHPLLAASSHSRAPISYDVIYPPSAQTVVDRTTRTAVPSHTLTQPATDPPTKGTLVLRSDKFPWPVVVQPSFENPRKSAAKFYLGESSSSHHSHSLTQGLPVTNNDLIRAIHLTLSARVTREEWDALGKGSRAQRKVTRAYEKRTRLMGDKEGGVRRVDWLGEKTRLIGIEVDKTASETGVAKLVFGRP
ncbi:hypothetical protein D9758_016576 [Tetrapyrgos nigripes]|uniref:DUF6699 domain-containing protein n=1 Tax=Tetrapyrgos nigripes TaxID=182062 RepID=A0A8H5C264_9AGAR|nr:hypothetical protein D9758_016576 [Tetrapyrgos nigripes]